MIYVQMKVPGQFGGYQRNLQFNIYQILTNLISTRYLGNFALLYGVKFV